MALSRLVEAAAEQARLVFGPAGEPVPVAELRDVGAGYYGEGSAAAAVGLLMTNDRPTVECLLGGIAAGVTVVSLPLPARGTDVGEYAECVAAACAAYGVAEVVADDVGCALLGPSGIAVRSHDTLRGRALAAPSGAFRLVQFSSGSTQLPKPVVLDDAELGFNVAAILDRVDPCPGDTVVSWLPLSHDMGLVGMLLASIVGMGPHGANGGDIVLLDPVQFMRAPGLWVRTLSERRGSVTATPDFGLRFASQRPPQDDVDLSTLRCVIVGGEIVRARSLAAFAATFANSGVRPDALCPAYGLAEVGLAVTMTSPADPWRTRQLSTRALAGHLLERPIRDEPAIDLVAAGPALPGYSLRIAAHGADGTGQILVRGGSIGLDGITGESFAGDDGWMATGDEGFVDDGWLYVVGRHDDHVVAHGRNLYAPAIEAAAGAVPGVRGGRVAAVSLPNGEWLVVAEAPVSVLRRKSSTNRLRQDIRRAVVQMSSAQPDDVVLVRRGGVPMTASGKLRRADLRARLMSGELSRDDDHSPG
jgi:acyl-CoA synthetase (AMP-forming)/AMP-acid ligase II